MRMEMQDENDLCFPQLLNSSCRKPKLHWTKAVLLNILMSGLSVTTVVLNLLVIISVSHFRQLHTPTNIFLLSLAVSDFLVGLLLMPVEILRNTACWLLGDITCSFYLFVVSLLLCVSNGNIVLISIDRYQAICCPLHYSTRITTAKARRYVFLCWLFSALSSIFYVRDNLIQPGRSKSCFGECHLTIEYVASIVDLIINFIFSVSLIVVLYMRVFVVAVSQARAMCSRVTAASLQREAKPKAKRSELKAARTLGVLVFVYLLCFCPYYSYSLVEVKITSSSFAIFLVFLFYSSSCFNPVIYALFYS
ncbi:trace amine-associated receptor 13c-like [Oryzias melastigma]|uniref:trace amine-associated receptor 13c-like n=1 Tax=Oryzias melastigma TaxID=30732 RepID=UPI00168D0C11|nr:trace amine-associated receptor 13c-like [Oryzias melastigma]